MTAADDHSTNTPEGTTHMRIRLTAGDTVLDATLADNATAHKYASLLPLTLQMSDLFRREKYGHLPRPLAAGGCRGPVVPGGQGPIGPAA
ncbi:cyclophilin-like fold protein [Streptomyces canus]|uniref:cyclophilin-like fold protein n=1 Tax=Streptomyces canus TaxID=58343 RepID=UPI0033C0EE62